MKTDNVLTALIAHNHNEPNLRYVRENTWFNEKTEYAELIGKLSKFVKNENIRGTLLVATDHDIMWTSGSRSKDINGEIVSPLTTYEIGSLTKSFTATLILKLHEEGKLSIWDNVTKYFPGYDKAGDMRVFNLLHMSSGIVNYNMQPEIFFGNDYETLRKTFWSGELSDEVLLEYLYKCELNFVPGTKCEYSNTNYRLLALILEMVTGRSYKELMYDTIFTPFGMRATSAGTLGDVTSCPETGDYIGEVNVIKGAGDIHSNVLDLLTFDRALFAGQIINEESLKTMFQFYPYGCGWYGWMKEQDGEIDVIGHGGATISYRCHNYVFCKPGQPRSYLIFMSPCCNDETDEIFDKLFDLCEIYLR